MTIERDIEKTFETRIDDLDDRTGTQVLATSPSGRKTIIDGDMAMHLIDELPDRDVQPTE